MTTGASRGTGGETGGHVVGNIAADGLRTIPRGLVATHAIRRGKRVAIVDMAGDAGRRRGGHVCARQSKASSGVIEGRGGPGDGVVAGGAIRSRESGAGCRVRGVIGLLPGGEVASGIPAIVGLNRQVVVSADVAQGAGC
jgi:hypothetical protein